ncbi:MAG: hypothetical protein IIZ46_08260, partial [Clostridia bacterium]|nr:hypothetical protein [Clostridia bacterium]
KGILGKSQYSCGFYNIPNLKIIREYCKSIGFKPFSSIFPFKFIIKGILRICTNIPTNIPTWEYCKSIGFKPFSSIFPFKFIIKGILGIM